MTCTALLSISSVSAQTSTANRPALVAKGYTQTDFKAAEQTQIGSNYLLYRKFSACLEEAGNGIVINNITDARAGVLIGQCEEEGLMLRAAISRSLGLTQATRVISMISYDFGLQLKKKMQKQNGIVQSGLTRIGPWLIEQFSPKSCIASVKAAGYTDDLRFMNFEGRMMVLLKTDFPQPEVGGLSKDIVTIGHYPAPSIIEGQFRSLRLDEQNWIASGINERDLGYIKNGGILNIQQYATTKLETRQAASSFREVLDFIHRCSH